MYLPNTILQSAHRYNPHRTLWMHRIAWLLPIQSYSWCNTSELYSQFSWFPLETGNNLQIARESSVDTLSQQKMLGDFSSEAWILWMHLSSIIQAVTQDQYRISNVMHLELINGGGTPSIGIPPFTSQSRGLPQGAPRLWMVAAEIMNLNSWWAGIPAILSLLGAAHTE